MGLHEVQIGLRDLLHEPNDARVPEDSELATYLRTVAASDRLGLVREIIAAWNAHDIARSCPLTSRALVARNRFDEAVTGSLRLPRPSAFIETFADTFLGWVAAWNDPFLAAVAGFERAYAAVRRGSTREFRVPWTQDPAETLAWLTADPMRSTVPSARSGRYTTVVSRQLPKLYVIEPGPDH